MSEELKPCPFCGSTNVEISPYGGAKAIACMDCFCRSEIFGGEDAKEKAIAAWNRRVQQPNEPLTVDELRKMIGQWVWVKSLLDGTVKGAVINNANAAAYVLCGVRYDTFGNYGKTWLAYRSKPEAGENND